MFKSLFFIFCFVFLNPFSVLCQEWCKKRNPENFDEPTGILNDKLESDRFQHTIKPDLINIRQVQFEVLTTIRPELMINNEWVNNDYRSVYDIYSSFNVKYSFYPKLEFQLCFTDLMIRVQDSVRQYALLDPVSPISIGAKYAITDNSFSLIKFSLFNQLSIPNLNNSSSSFMLLESRLLAAYSGKKIMVTGNLGFTSSNYLDKIIGIYSLELKYRFRRIDLFSEFYRNYSKTGPPRNPNKRGLLGIGYYILQNLYIYSTFEVGWDHEESLNDGRHDIGKLTGSGSIFLISFKGCNY
jgi:hypothetical protein